MSLEAHKGQILPLTNQHIPISRNTTFHASYDNDWRGLNQGTPVAPFGYAKSLSFDSTTKLTLPNPIQQANTAQDWTVECWVKVAIASNTNQYFMNLNFGVYFTYSSADPRLLLYLNSGTYDYYSYGAKNLKDGLWHHVAFTFKNSTGARAIYVDGVDVTVAGGPNQYSTPLGLPTSLVIGDNFTGSLSEVRVWNYSRTAQNIKDTMNQELTGSEAGLIGYWKLNEGNGNIVRDSSPNCMDGVVTGTLSWTEGRVIAPLRPVEGKFGGAVSIDGSTTNILTNPEDPTKWTLAKDPAWGFVSDAFIDTDLGTKGYQRTVTGTDYRGSLIQMNWTTPTNMSTPYTFSMYARALNPSANAKLQLNYQGADASSTRTDINKYVTLDKPGWQRVTLTATPADSNFATLIGYMKVYVQSSDGNPVTIQMTMPQVEQKAFASSYVLGSRTKGRLMYPKEVLPLNAFTFNAWVKLNGYTNIAQPIFELGADTTTRILLSHQSASSALGVWKTGHTDMISATIPPVDTWYMVTLTYDGTSYRLYYNGALLLTQNNNKWVGTDNDTFNLGGWYGGTLDGLVDDVRIDAVAATADEILSWYVSGMPFYNYLDYTGVGY